MRIHLLIDVSEVEVVVVQCVVRPADVKRDDWQSAARVDPRAKRDRVVPVGSYVECLGFKYER